MDDLNNKYANRNTVCPVLTRLVARKDKNTIVMPNRPFCINKKASKYKMCLAYGSKHSFSEKLCAVLWRSGGYSVGTIKGVQYFGRLGEAGGGRILSVLWRISSAK